MSSHPRVSKGGPIVVGVKTLASGYRYVIVSLSPGYQVQVMMGSANPVGQTPEQAGQQALEYIQGLRGLLG